MRELAERSGNSEKSHSEMTVEFDSTRVQNPNGTERPWTVGQVSAQDLRGTMEDQPEVEFNDERTCALFGI